MLWQQVCQAAEWALLIELWEESMGLRYQDIASINTCACLPKNAVCALVLKFSKPLTVRPMIFMISA
jgi:hypothetical protein